MGSIEYCSVKEFLFKKCQENKDDIFIKEYETSKSRTYGSFWRDIVQACTTLIEAGIKKREKVLLPMDNTISSLAIFMGAIVSDIIPVPISKELTEEEIELIVNCENIEAVIVQGKKDIIKSHCRIVEFEDKQCDAKMNIGLDEEWLENIAYIMFTSGSTGKPKKIEISNLNMLVEIQCMAEAYNLIKYERHLCVLPVYHASGLFRNILLPFHVGGEVVIVSKFMIEDFWNIVYSEKINFVQVVPSIIRLLMMDGKNVAPLRSQGLKYIGSASAPHPVLLIESFQKRFGIEILQAYGMTEATCGITLNTNESGKNKIGSVGKPLKINELIICDERGEILPSGEIGRVMVSGLNIAKNCLRYQKESSNNEKYGWLDTGDCGYLDEDGFLWLVGRKDDLIKRGGYRISPNEIEDVISEAFPTLESAVVGVPHPILGQDIVAFVVKDTNNNISSRNVISRLKKMINASKIPSKILFVDLIPKLGPGKVDRNKLTEYHEQIQKEEL